MKVYPKTLNEDKEKISLSGMQVTLFRNLADKKKNLPHGEGDGKYTYAELLNPQYNTQDAASTSDKIDAGGIFSAKMNANSGLPDLQCTILQSQSNYSSLPALLQSQYPYYFIESSSYVAENNLTYQATIRESPQVPQVTETNWANPEIPVVEADVILQPLVSRALITVRDVKSGSVVTKNHGARVMLSKEQSISGNSNFKPFRWMITAKPKYLLPEAPRLTNMLQTVRIRPRYISLPERTDTGTPGPEQAIHLSGRVFQFVKRYRPLTRPYSNRNREMP